jgi:hypothetical protein
MRDRDEWKHDVIAKRDHVTALYGANFRKCKAVFSSVTSISCEHDFEWTRDADFGLGVK